MDLNIIYIENEKTWPNSIADYLEKNFTVLNAWYQNKSYKDSFYKAKSFDQVICGLSHLLMNYFLHGYHCTRLTGKEIAMIKRRGMSLPNKSFLFSRIHELKNDGIISSEVIPHLISQNEAGDESRANMIWFCFFKPKLALQSGIERFFRSWGGEALYNSHEENPITGPVLMQIGTPCIIEVKVPIKNIYVNGLSLKIARQYAINRAIIIEERNEHEGYSTNPIPASLIIDIIKFPEPKFIELTDCFSWKPALSI